MMDLIKNAINDINVPVTWAIDPIQMNDSTCEDVFFFHFSFISLLRIRCVHASSGGGVCAGNDCEGDK